MADVLFFICDLYVFLSIVVFLFLSVFSAAVYCREFYLFLVFFLSYSPVEVGNRLTFNRFPFSSEDRRFAWEEFIYYCSVVLVFLVSYPTFDLVFFIAVSFLSEDAAYTTYFPFRLGLFFSILGEIN
jgi:hypothetical protein